MPAIFSNMHHRKLWVKTNYSTWSIFFLQKIVIIGETIQKETLMQSSRPMINKMSWKGELIQFELRESISTTKLIIRNVKWKSKIVQQGFLLSSYVYRCIQKSHWIYLTQSWKKPPREKHPRLRQNVSKSRKQHSWKFQNSAFHWAEWHTRSAPIAGINLQEGTFIRQQ